MASIKGVKLTGIQSHPGLEGYTLFAVVNMDGRTAGFVRDDAYGGPWDIGIPADVQEEIRRRYREFIAETRKVDEMKLFHMTAEEFVERRDNGTLPVQEDDNLEFFFSELADLRDAEKRFKSAVKKGYRATVEVKFFHINGPTPLGYAYQTGGSPKTYKEIYDEAVAKSPAVLVTQYDSLDDFDL